MLSRRLQTQLDTGVVYMADKMVVVTMPRLGQKLNASALTPRFSSFSFTLLYFTPIANFVLRPSAGCFLWS